MNTGYPATAMTLKRGSRQTQKQEGRPGQEQGTNQMVLEEEECSWSPAQSSPAQSSPAQPGVRSLVPRAHHRHKHTTYQLQAHNDNRQGKATRNSETRDPPTARPRQAAQMSERSHRDAGPGPGPGPGPGVLENGSRWLLLCPPHACMFLSPDRQTEQEAQTERSNCRVSDLNEGQ